MYNEIYRFIRSYTSSVRKKSVLVSSYIIPVKERFVLVILNTMEIDVLHMMILKHGVLFP